MLPYTGPQTVQLGGGGGPPRPEPQAPPPTLLYNDPSHSQPRYEQQQQPQPRYEQQQPQPRYEPQPPPRDQQPPAILYPGKPTPANQLYGSANINGHENPEYQMSVVIRNPQMIPDYSAGESSLVNKELQLDQGAPLSSSPPTPLISGSPSETFPLETRVDLGGEAAVEQQKGPLSMREHAWRQQFRHEEEAAPSGSRNPVKAPANVNVTLSVAGDSGAAPTVVKLTQATAGATVPDQPAA